MIFLGGEEAAILLLSASKRLFFFSLFRYGEMIDCSGASFARRVESEVECGLGDSEQREAEVARVSRGPRRQLGGEAVVTLAVARSALRVSIDFSSIAMKAFKLKKC